MISFGGTPAEMALPLRRVLHRFDVDPSDVRFVATPAPQISQSGR